MSLREASRWQTYIRNEALLRSMVKDFLLQMAPDIYQ
jgi:hypothetical protein